MKNKLSNWFSKIMRKLDVARVNTVIAVVLLTVGTLAFLSLNAYKFAALSFVLLLVVILLNVLLGVFKKRSLARAVKRMGIYREDGKGSCYGIVGDFMLPLVVLKADGSYFWGNGRFEELCKEKNLGVKEYASELFFDYDKALGEHAEKHGNPKDFSFTARLGNSSYLVYLSPVTDRGFSSRGELFAIYMVDITAKELLTGLYKERRIAVGEIIIDNYDEIFQASGEAVMNQILVEVSKIFDEWLRGKDAIVKRLVRERYIFIIEKRYLEQIKNERFDILERVKKISKGNNIPVTLSIGISDNCSDATDNEAFEALSRGELENEAVKTAFGDSLVKHFTRSEELINLALGRGGDQAILQEGEESFFYGGSEIDLDRGNKVKARVVANIMRKEILESSRVLVMGHSNADLDALGASLAVYRIAQVLGKEAYVVLERPNSQIAVMYESLMKDGGYGDVFIKKSEALNILDEKTFVVLVDTFSAKQSEAPEVIENAPTIAVIDHHRRGIDYIRDTVFTYTETAASSASELVIEIMRYIAPKLTLPVLEAETLYGGILIDTKNLYFKTGRRTFEATSFLRTQGVNPLSVRKYVQPDAKSYVKINHILGRMKTVKIDAGDGVVQGIAFSRCDISQEESNTVAPIAADKMLEIAGIDASFVLIQFEAGVAIKARSLGDVNVQIILENKEIGGGGHLTAAGGFAKGKTVKEVLVILSRIMGFDPKTLAELEKTDDENDE